jgi:tripartite-type tricarboxylate transporter receptor subunit TctC
MPGFCFCAPKPAAVACPVQQEGAMTIRRISRSLLHVALVLSASLAMPLGAFAQTPGRTITIVVPFTPGTGPDILARTIGEEIQRRWNQPVVVDNKPGASGNIGTQVVARAAPDGHTLLMTSNPFTANISLLKDVAYDPIKSFAPIVAPGYGVLALAVHPSLPVASTKEFIDYAKARPNEIDYGSPGIGTPHHLAMELFKLSAKVEVRHIPYRGSAGAVTDLIGGHVKAGFMAVHLALPLVRENQMRLLGVASLERAKVAPDLPTLDSQGITGFEVHLWYGLLAPAGTPREVILRYNAVVNEILQQPKTADALARQGLTVAGGTPEQFGQFVAADSARWQKVVKDAGISAQ